MAGRVPAIHHALCSEVGEMHHRRNEFDTEASLALDGGDKPRHDNGVDTARQG